MNAPTATRIALASIGGAAALGVAVFGILAWMEISGQEDVMYSLEANAAKRARHAAASTATAAAHKKNAAAAKEWADAAYAFASSQGAYALSAPLEPAAFKQQMAEDARALSKLPEDAPAKFVKEGFGFGFDKYVNGGAMPPRDALPRLRRQWDDIVRISRILASCGAAELTGVSVQEAPAAPEPPRGAAARMRQKQVDPAAEYPSSEETYVFSFLARPAPLVRIMNALASDGRFFAVSGLTFEQPGDPLAVMLGGDKEKERERGARRSSRRSRRDAAPAPEPQNHESEEAEIARKGLVTDPAVCAPFAVTMKISTLDFSPKSDGKEQGK